MCHICVQSTGARKPLEICNALNAKQKKKKKKNSKRVQMDALPPSLQLAGEVFHFNLSFGANGKRHQLEMSFDMSCSQMQKTPRMKNRTGGAFWLRMHGYVENIIHTVNTPRTYLRLEK